MALEKVISSNYAMIEYVDSFHKGDFYMNQLQNNKDTFDTSSPYAIFHGFLILPFLIAVMQFLGAIIMIIAANPTSLEGFDRVIYFADVVRIPLLLLTFWAMVKRSHWYRWLMIIFFWGNGFYLAAFYYNDLPTDTFQIVMCVVFVVYFLLSKRVKATFHD